MPRWNFERELIVSLLCIAACATLAVTAAGSDWTRRAMNGTAEILLWPERPAVLFMERFGQFRRWTEERRALLMELAELRDVNRTLSMQVGENVIAGLKKSSRPQNRYPIVYRHPRDWWESVRISTGKENFEPGTAVFDGSDLVGVVSSQGDGTAWVKLITSSSFYVPVVVEETREIGAVTGDNEGGVWLMYLPSNGGYRPGMKIRTVLGSRLPAGIPVGELTGERRSLIPGIDEYRVEPAADVFRLQYVSIAGGGETS